MVSSRARARAAVAGCAVALVVAACSGSDDGSTQSTPPPPPRSSGVCGDFAIAYDPSNGYEASAFIVGAVAERALHCQVEYVKTTSRDAWQLVADGGADVYMDAYGNDDLRAELGVGEPTADDPSSAPPPEAPNVAIIGPNGVKGAVNLLAPAFMGDRGLRHVAGPRRHGADRMGRDDAGDHHQPELVRLAHTVINSLRLDYVVRNIVDIDGRRGMRLPVAASRATTTATASPTSTSSRLPASCSATASAAMSSTCPSRRPTAACQTGLRRCARSRASTTSRSSTPTSRSRAARRTRSSTTTS